MNEVTAERVQAIKGLPLADLSLTAICVCVGEFEGEDGNLHAEYEYEPINQKDWEQFNAPKSEANRCAMCGHGLKVACAVTHKSTGNGYWVGRDCANKIKTLAPFVHAIHSATVALAERIACDKREADFLTAHPDAMSILAWCKAPRAPRIAKDMVQKMRRYGNLSEKQVALLEKIRQQDVERRAKATAVVVPGRQVIKGIVCSVKVVSDEFSDTKRAKILVDMGTGVRLYGNCPEYLDITELTRPRLVGTYMEKAGQAWTHEVIKIGDTVEFTATVTASDNDDLFGFWKRPAKFNITALAEPPSAPAPMSERELFHSITNTVDFQKAMATGGHIPAVKHATCLAVAKHHGLTDEQTARFIIAVMTAPTPL